MAKISEKDKDEVMDAPGQEAKAKREAGGVTAEEKPVADEVSDAIKKAQRGVRDLDWEDKLPYGQRIPEAYDMHALAEVFKAHGEVLDQVDRDLARQMFRSWARSFTGVQQALGPE